MRVLLYTHEFPPFLGGLATTSYKLAKGIRERGLDVTVLAPGYSPKDWELDMGLSFMVIRMGRLARNHGIPSPVKEVKGFFSLRKAILQVNPDAILFVTREAHTAGGLLANLPFKVVVRVAGYEATKCLLGRRIDRKLFGLPMRRLYMRADRIVSPSNSTRELMVKAGIPREKIRVIYNGVNPEMLSLKPDADALKKIRIDLGIRDDEKVILTVARLVQGKGQDTVIRVLPRILRGYDRFKYLIVGEGSYEKKLRELTYREGVESKVVFAGPVPHGRIMDFYDLSDIFVMPNRTIEGRENTEGLPNVILEAASRGKPIITGIPGGGKEVVEHGRTGYVVDGEDTDKIANYILDLLKDESKARSFGILGRQRIESMFTEERMIDEYLSLISENPD
jgi:phosphatidylinositol alpha-1,6-mannosyltransferase